jgi:hypothetical protein
MTRLVALALVAVVAGCDDHEIGQPQPPKPACSGSDTWETYGQSHVRTWCMSCHSSELPLGYRYDAPLGVDFDTYDMFMVWQVPAAERATSTGALFPTDPMPPAGGVPEDPQERFDAWMACGAPGEGTPVVPECVGPEIAGDRTIGGDAAVTALCAEGSSLTGTLTVSGSADVSCLCAVGGDVQITGAAVDVRLPILASIGGSLRADAPGLVSLTVDEPLNGLRSVGGDVLLSNLPAVTAILLGELVEVGGDFLVADDPMLTNLDTPRLASVGGAFQVERNTALPVMDIPVLVSVGGDFVIADNPALEILGDGYGLDDVGGSFRLVNNDSWMGMVNGSFGKLQTIGAALEIEGNASLNQIAGYTELTSVGAGVRIVDNDLATKIDGFDNLATVGGDLEISGNANLLTEEAFNLLVTVVGTVRVVDDPKLASFEGIARADNLGGLNLENLPLLGPLGTFLGVSSIGGDLRLVALGAPMTSIAGFTALQTVSGTLEISDNVGLANLSGLMGVDAVGADLTIVGNHALPDAEAAELETNIDSVAGTTSIYDNGG